MRRGWLVVCLWLMGVVLGQEETPTPSYPQALAVCQAAYQQLRPLYLYAERLPGGKVVMRLVLGIRGIPLVRLSLDGQAEPIPAGLEGMASGIGTNSSTPNQVLRAYVERLDRLRNELFLANWFTPEVRGYRCFLTYQGQVVGILRVAANNLPRPEPKWRETYLSAPLKWPAQPVLAEPRSP